MQEDYSKEFEEKKSELQAKVIEIYEASTAEIKVVIYFNNFSHFSNKLKKLKWGYANDHYSLINELDKK